MSEVQPIRKEKQVRDIGNYLRVKNEKYYIMYLIGVQSGLRVSDILNLRVKDIQELCNRKITEKKTSKKRYLYLNKKAEKEVEQYIKDNSLSSDDFLIRSRKKDKDGNYQPITRTQAYRVLREAGESFGVSNLGTHTMRKTFGYHYYQKTHDIVTLMQIFNHSSQQITLKYIGVNEEMIRKSLDDFWLF